MSSAGRSVSPCLQYNVQSLGKDRFRFISPYTTVRLDKRQKIFFHTDIVLHSANTSEIQATKKPHNYHKIAVWQKDDRIRKSPLKFYAHYYSIFSGECQASIITKVIHFCYNSIYGFSESTSPTIVLQPQIYDEIDMRYCLEFFDILWYNCFKTTK